MTELWHRKEKWSPAQWDAINHWRSRSISEGVKHPRKLTTDEKRRNAVSREKDKILENRRWQEEMGTSEVWD